VLDVVIKLDKCYSPAYSCFTTLTSRLQTVTTLETIL